MKIPPVPHAWDLTPKEAVALQKELAPSVVVAPPAGRIRWVAGTDLAFTKDKKRAIAAAVLWDLRYAEVEEQHTVVCDVSFPYVPGLLSFRETPAILAALAKLEREPDALMIDGHGLAHPRRFGIACHVGVLCDRPTIGVAKSVLCGEYEAPHGRRGTHTPLVHEGEVVGSVLLTRPRVKPVFVSVGHRIDLESAERITLDAAVQYRLPEPTRRADRLVAEVKEDLS